jgi:hypothetical protein
MQKDDRAEDAATREATDRLALALEDAGFDVGQEFPDLHDAIGREGSGIVRIGDVTPLVADRLAGALYSGYVGAEEGNDS